MIVVVTLSSWLVVASMGCNREAPRAESGCAVWEDCCSYACGTPEEAASADPPDCDCARMERSPNVCALHDDATCDWR